MHAQVGGGDPHRQHCKGGVRHAPPPSLARAEDSGARGDVILAVLVLEAIVVVTLNVLEKFQALRRCHRALVIVVDPTNDVTAMLPEGKDMAGGGWGGPVIFPHHPDNDDAGRLLDDMGSTNANDDDNDDTPPRPPPENGGDAPRGAGGQDDNGAGRRRDGGGGEQGCGRDEHDECDKRDRSSGSARSACDGGDMVVVPRAENIVWYCTHLSS